MTSSNNTYSLPKSFSNKRLPFPISSSTNPKTLYHDSESSTSSMMQCPISTNISNNKHDCKTPLLPSISSILQKMNSCEEPHNLNLNQNNFQLNTQQKSQFEFGFIKNGQPFPMCFLLLPPHPSQLIQHNNNNNNNVNRTQIQNENQIQIQIQNQNQNQNQNQIQIQIQTQTQTQIQTQPKKTKKRKNIITNNNRQQNQNCTIIDNQELDDNPEIDVIGMRKKNKKLNKNRQPRNKTNKSLLLSPILPTFKHQYKSSTVHGVIEQPEINKLPWM